MSLPAANGPPRLAASVILARPAAGGGFEAYMTRRSARSGFAPDAFVFPGGVVDASDGGAAMRARTTGLEAAFADARRPATELGEPKVAGLRELFEEAGILIARSRDGAPADAAHVRSPAIQAERVRLRRGERAFADFLQAHGWYADAGALVAFSHWITPLGEPRRYDTHFFFAVAPDGQAGRADAHETHDGVWISPGDALARYRDGSFRLVYPTIKHLERLAALRTLGEAVEFARRKPIVTVLPDQSGGTFVIAPELEDAW